MSTLIYSEGQSVKKENTCSPNSKLIGLSFKHTGSGIMAWTRMAASETGSLIVIEIVIVTAELFTKTSTETFILSADLQRNPI